MIRVCRHCGNDFETTNSTKKSCSIKCANAFRYKDPRRKAPQLEYRGASYRNFLMSLRTKLSQRRDLDIDFLCQLYENQKGLCALSDRQMTFITGQGLVTTNISIDRINPIGPYEEGNIRLVCRQANIMKQRLSDEDLADWCKDIDDKRKRK